MRARCCRRKMHSSTITGMTPQAPVAERWCSRLQEEKGERCRVILNSVGTKLRDAGN
jgi:hypothetical protein